MVSPLDWSQSRQGVMSYYKLGMSTGNSLEDFSCLNCFAATVSHQLSELLTGHLYLESIFIILSALSQKMIEHLSGSDVIYQLLLVPKKGNHEEMFLYDF